MSAHRSSITAVILAGGAGTRVGGRDKGLIEWRARPLIGHVLEALAPQAGRLLISANRNLDVYERYGHRVLRDRVDGFAGPLAGVASALGATTTPWLLTVPVDGPIFPLDLAARLLEALSAANASAAVAHDWTRRQPLFALYSTRLYEPANAALAAGEGAVWRFQDACGAVEVGFAGAQFSDLDEFDVPGYADGF